MQPTPPDPHFPSALLTAIAAMLFQLSGIRSPDSGTALGFLTDSAGTEKYILPAGDGTLGGIAWTTYGIVPGPGRDSAFERHLRHADGSAFDHHGSSVTP